MPEAGWYDDPESGLHIRYWDGSTWTEERRPRPPASAAVTAAGASGRSFVAVLVLAVILGAFGVHRFYVGKVGTGILMLVTLGGFGIWQLIDIILIAVGRFTDSAGLPVRP